MIHPTLSIGPLRNPNPQPHSPSLPTLPLCDYYTGSSTNTDWKLRCFSFVVLVI